MEEQNKVKQKLLLFITLHMEISVMLKGIKKAGDVTMLGYNGRVNYKKTGSNLIISVPAISSANFKGQHAWVFKIGNYE